MLDYTEEKNSKGLQITIVLLVVLLLVAAFFLLQKDRLAPEGETPDTETPTSTPITIPDSWNTYENGIYEFTLEYPSEWTVSEDELPGGTPAINIFDPSHNPSLEAPFDHFTDAFTVSVFPSGIPTEGVFGKREPSNVSLGEESETAEVYVLSDGEPWALRVVFANPPVNWKEWGYLWARVPVRDLRVECRREGEAISAEACDPLFGDEVIHHGSVDPDDWALIEEAVGSFRFTNDR